MSGVGGADGARQEFTKRHRHVNARRDGCLPARGVTMPWMAGATLAGQMARAVTGGYRCQIIMESCLLERLKERDMIPVGDQPDGSAHALL